MIKIISQIKYRSENFRYLFKRHVFNQLSARTPGKIFHYLKILLRHKMFGYPRLAIIETGTTCNINCPTCPTPRSYLNRPPSMMNLEDFKKIIDRVKDQVHVVLLHHTNEPLLNRQLPEMIAYAGKCNLYTVISTNAALLSQEKTGQILDSGLDEILLCLDGMTKESYEPFRVGANFETVIGNIRNFCAEREKRRLRKPYVELQFIVTKLNQDQIPEVTEFCRENNMDRLKLKSVAVVGYYYTPEERAELLKKFLPDKENSKKRYSVDEKGDAIRNEVLRCDLIKDQIAVLVNGDMTLCCFDVRGEYVYGNLLKDDFETIWQNPKNKKMRKQAAKRNFELCKKCEIF